jgi:hypothetical protein
LTEPEIPSEIVTHAIVEVPVVAYMAVLDLLADLEDAGDPTDAALTLLPHPLAVRLLTVRDSLRFSDPAAQGRALEELLPAVRARAELAVILTAREHSVSDGTPPVDPEVLPKCTNPECRGITFQVVPAAPSFAPEEQELVAGLDFVCCATCGAIVGVIDNRAAELIENRIAEIKRAKEGTGER